MKTKLYKNYKKEKKMKKITAVVLALVMLVLMCSCSSTYKNSYNAKMLTKSSGGDDCEVEFGELDGTLVLKATVGRDNCGMIHYDADLHEGEITVYYDINDTGKKFLFSISGGQNLDTRAAYVTKGDKVTFIIETNGLAKIGEIDIDFD